MRAEPTFDRAALETVLSASSDPQNPDVDTIYRIVRDTLRIAVVGLSRDPSKPARRIPSYLAAKGADIFPVNPFAERILGRPARDRLGDVTEEVDMVLVFRPSDQAGAVVLEAMEREERPYIWLQEGIRADAEAAAAREAGLLVVQDLCIYSVHRAFGDTFRRARDRDPGTADIPR
ncbi:MAG: CoA-binding protein [Gemmatimonadetes bacterium]|nr:CoA-binding protein [Gemmatimonadota bacterium]NNK63076.1 CoA-binding protein [Gemmatimonadota bacterium]